MKKIVLMLMLSVFITGIASAQTTDTVSTNFVKNAIMGGNMDIKAGKLAVQKGKSASVKAYGAQMIKDHTLAGAELKKIALKKGYSTKVMDMPGSPLLTSTSGTEFDKNYVTMMVADHKKTVALFENASANAKDAAIKAYANKTLPKLKQHLTTIQNIASKMNLAM